VFAGRFVDAEAELANAWRGVSDARDQTALRATVATYLAVLAMARMSDAEMVAWSGRALAQDGARPEIMALAWWARSWGLASSGRAEEALREFDAVASSGVLGEIDVLWIRGQLAVWRDDFPGAASSLAACLARVGDARGDRSLLTCVAACLLAQALYRLGRFAEAIQQIELGLAIAQEAGRSVDLLFIHAMAAYPRIARGDWDAAAAHVREALTHGRVLGAPGTMAYATAAAARLAAARGDQEEVLRAIAALPDPRGPWEQSLLPIGDLAVEASLALGRVDEAVVHLTTLETAPAARRPLGHAMIARARGAIEAACGRPDAARMRFEEALGHLRGLCVPLEEARVQLDLGRVLRRSGDRAGARRHLVAARDTFAALGARPDMEAAARELPATSARQPRAARSGIWTLTPQETVVARLVAAGKSNRQVAADLFVTVKTVEYHLANIYAKLGIFSRAQLREHLTAATGLASSASTPPRRAAAAQAGREGADG